MTFKKFLGGALLAMPFAGIAAASWSQLGGLQTIGVFAVTAAVFLLIFSGVWLLND